MIISPRQFTRTAAHSGGGGKEGGGEGLNNIIVASEQKWGHDAALFLANFRCGTACHKHFKAEEGEIKRMTDGCRGKWQCVPLIRQMYSAAANIAEKRKRIEAFLPIQPRTLHTPQDGGFMSFCIRNHAEQLVLDPVGGVHLVAV